MTGPIQTIGPADALAFQLLDFFCAQDFAPVDPPMLLPADLVLDPMGEDIRARLLIVTSPDGAQLCLRPDFTLPVAQHHLDQVAAGATTGGRYAYSGEAFRFPAPGEIARPSVALRQAGVEIFGDEKPAETDAQVLGLAVEAVKLGGLETIDLTLGDVSLFGAFVDALGLPGAVARHLKARFARGLPMMDRLNDLTQPAEGPAVKAGRPALGAALSALDKTAARAVIEEIMDIAGVGLSAHQGLAGGRSPEEIAKRFVEQATLARGDVLTPQISSVIETYLAISDNPRAAAKRLDALARDNSLDLGPALEAFSHRLDLIENQGVDLENARFSADFGRTIAYYTGLVFEIRDPSQNGLGQIAGGGRYDEFMGNLGAKPGMAAVGCSIYVDRLAAALAGRP